MNKKVLLILILSIIGIRFGYSQSGFGSYPVYYAKSLTYIYQHPNSESAIKGEIPTGESVKVMSSGNTTFWRVDYKDKIGWVKKNQLSYKKTTSSTETKKTIYSFDNGTTKNQDVGFDPFLAQTTSSVNFRNGPSSSSSKIKTLSTGSTVYVYSNKSINKYYKVIDVMTSQIGWVHKNYVRYVQDVDVNEQGAFQSTGYTASYNSEVSVRNKSTYTIKLVVGDETFTLSPNSTKSVNVKPGRKYYIATAPGVIPASGYQSFQSNNGYEWEFWVQTSK